MTELQWLIKMLTQTKMPKPIKDLFIERLGEVETSLGSRPIQQQPIQAQSYMNTNPIAPQLPPREIPNQIVNNGDGTRGPRKW